MFMIHKHKNSFGIAPLLVCVRLNSCVFKNLGQKIRQKKLAFFWGGVNRQLYFPATSFWVCRGVIAIFQDDVMP
jgi:hypothetical protein